MQSSWCTYYGMFSYPNQSKAKWVILVSRVIYNLTYHFVLCILSSLHLHSQFYLHRPPSCPMNPKHSLCCPIRKWSLLGSKMLDPLLPFFRSLVKSCILSGGNFILYYYFYIPVFCGFFSFIALHFSTIPSLGWKSMCDIVHL